MIKKLKEKKGFTLAELLVVVAIIGVLVAVSIPIFTGQLEKSRDAVTVANLRSAYAQAQTAFMTETTSTGVTYDQDTNTVAVEGVVAKGVKANDFSKIAEDLPFHDKKAGFTDMDNVKGTYTVTFTYKPDGTIDTVKATKTGE